MAELPTARSNQSIWPWRFAEADPQASASHDFTADGLRKLAAGLEAVAPPG